ncbi:MAG: type III-B CRISPR module RAMP protein Cmr1 [Candidatus Methanoperedens sp.]|nr:type III-B CRISPR module RAMP protein Cmr1 [Candidatus Methanoperedens sp.]
MIKVNLRTLTPIWTGDVNRECKEIKETGIIGSLRWWYEALVRGMGGYACDPSNSSCKADVHCAVCHIFGCTGWSRTFRIVISETDRKYAPFVIVKPGHEPSFLGYYDPTGRSYQKNGGKLSTLSISTCARHNIEPDLLTSLFNFMSEWGIGARTQTGFGISQIIDSRVSISSELLPKPSKEPQQVDYEFELPALNNFFFTKIPLKAGVVHQIKSEILKNVYKTRLFSLTQISPKIFRLFIKN